MVSQKQNKKVLQLWYISLRPTLIVRWRVCFYFQFILYSYFKILECIYLQINDEIVEKKSGSLDEKWYFMFQMLLFFPSGTFSIGWLRKKVFEDETIREHIVRFQERKNNVLNWSYTNFINSDLDFIKLTSLQLGFIYTISDSAEPLSSSENCYHKYKVEDLDSYLKIFN